MHILLISDFFAPEVTAPAIRGSKHCLVWAQENNRVTVLTGVPNMPRGVVFPGYKNRLFQREHGDDYDIVRVWTYIAANKGVYRRILDYLSFMISGFFGGLFIRGVDVVIATSPQFFAAVGGWALAKVKRVPFVLEIRDLWPEHIVSAGGVQSGFVLSLFEKLVNFIYKRANTIIVVTNAFKNVLIEKGIPGEKIHVVTNGVDVDEIKPSKSVEMVKEALNIPKGKILAGYIGTFGMAHGLNTLIAAADRLSDKDNIHILMMGDGAVKDDLIEQATSLALTNITFLDQDVHQEAINVLNACDISLVILKDAPVFAKVLPSKIFDAMALSIPIILGVRGESLELIESANCGRGIPPGDAEALANAVIKFSKDAKLRETLGSNGRLRVRRDYQRSKLALKMLRHVEDTVSGETDSQTGGLKNPEVNE